MKKLPIDFGYVIKREPKSQRRTFAMQKSLLDALAEIAESEGTNVNALVNGVLTDYAFDYFSDRARRRK